MNQIIKKDNKEGILMKIHFFPFYLKQNRFGMGFSTYLRLKVDHHRFNLRLQDDNLLK